MSCPSGPPPSLTACPFSAPHAFLPSYSIHKHRQNAPNSPRNWIGFLPICNPTPALQGFMAALYREHGGGSEISRLDIQAAIAKAVELRALHAALMQGGSPSSNPRLPSASPFSGVLPHPSAQDYPVFNPTYEDEPLPGYHQESRKHAESWGDHAVDIRSIDEAILSDYRTSVKEWMPSGLMNLEDYICPAEDQDSVAGSMCRAMSRRSSVGDVKSVSSYKCRPIMTSNDSDSVARSSKKSNIVVPVADARPSQPRNKGAALSWLFPKMKRKDKKEDTPQPDDDLSQKLKDMGMEALKKELIEAQGSRDAALIEVSGMRSSLGEISQKLEYLEAYCEELKRALRQAVQVKISRLGESLSNLPKRGKSVDGNAETMVEGFLQVVSESRLSVKQFCKTLLGQIQETDHTLSDNLNVLLQPYRLSLNSRHSKAVLYHVEAVINQSLHQDFENCTFQKNGTPKLLDPKQERRAKLQLLVALRNLSWDQVLRKGTKYYSHDFSKFCDQKMGSIISALGWSRPWPEQLLQAFFVAAKCIWLLHLMAFSFDPPLGILRVEENRAFEPRYMDDIFADKQREAPSRVKVMVMPGFYVHDKVVRCKVLCSCRHSPLV